MFAPLVCFPSCRDTPGIPRALPIDRAVFCLQGKARAEVLWGCLQRSGHLGRCLHPLFTAPAPRRVRGRGGERAARAVSPSPLWHKAPFLLLGCLQGTLGARRAFPSPGE